jgi:nitrogen fixation protein FixH
MDERREQAVDAEGTTTTEGREIIQRLRDQGFEGDDERLAVALGRPVEQVQAWTSGEGETIDDDIVMKARGIAKERGLDIG